MRVRAIIYGAALASTVLPAAAALPAAAQGTLEDYRRAADVRQRLDGLTVGVAGAPTWIDGSSRFWYRLSVVGGHEFVVVDAETREKAPAFDHAGIAGGLSAATGREYDAVTLPFRAFEYVEDGRAIEVGAAGGRWTCSLDDFGCEAVEETGGGGRGGGGGGFGSFPVDRNDGPPRVSPDGRTEAFITTTTSRSGPWPGRRGRGRGAVAAARRPARCSATTAPRAIPTSFSRSAGRRTRSGWSPTGGALDTTARSTSSCRPPRTGCSPGWTRCSTASRATCSTSTGPCSSTSRSARRCRSTTRSSERVPDLVGGVEGRRAGVHIRVQPARPPGVPRHRGGCGDGRGAGRRLRGGAHLLQLPPDAHQLAGLGEAVPPRHRRRAGGSSGCRSGTGGTTSTCTTASPAG